MQTKAPTSIINFVHNGKAVSFDPSEFQHFGDNPQDSFELAIHQYSVSAFWLATMRKRRRVAEQEVLVYTGRLYHSLKIDGGYQAKYKGSRPTEESLKQAIWDDKTYRELSNTLSELDEIIDQLWGLQRTVERKFDAIKEICALTRAARYRPAVAGGTGGEMYEETH
jgi:hypothetical protein